MLSAGEMEALPMALEGHFKELEKRIMSDIVRRLKANAGEITRAADWQIYRMSELGKSKKEIKKAIQDALKMSEAEIDNIYSEAIASGYTRSKSLYEAAGKAFIPYNENKQLQQLISAVKTQTTGEFTNITNSLGVIARNNGKLTAMELPEYYQKTLDSAVLDITSGAFDYNSVLKRTVREFTDSGVRFVDYDGNRPTTARIEVAARRAVMTGVSQVTAKVNEENAAKLETDTYEVSWHGGARYYPGGGFRSHLDWQGRWYTMEQLRSICGYGNVAGLCGANCYHDFDPVIPGLSEPTYTEAELAKMKQDELTPQKYGDKEYTKYEALQRQRELERTMRARREEIKGLIDGGANEDDITLTRASYRAVSQEYTRFSKTMGLPQQRERVSIDGLGDIGKGKTKVNTLDKSAKNDIIKSDDNEQLNIISLAKIKNRIRSNKDVSDEYYDTLKNKFSQGTDEAQKAFAKYVPKESVSNGNHKGTAYYSLKTKKIEMDFSADLDDTNPSGGGATWLHEHGHLIDDYADNVSNNFDFYKLLDSDYNDSLISYGKSHNLNLLSHIQYSLASEFTDTRTQSAVSDIFNGLSKGIIKGDAGFHNSNYWKNESTICAEAFAHMYEAQFDKTRYNELKKYFPNALNKFEQMLKEISK